MRKHPRRARVDPENPRAWATDDRTGFIGNQQDLKWQYEWAGTRLINTRILTFDPDEPQRQLGVVILPPDPLPILNARPEQYDIDEIPISTRYTVNGNIRTVVPTSYGHRPPPYYDQRIITYKGLPGPHLPLPVIPPAPPPPPPAATVFHFNDPAQTQYLIIIGTGI